LQNPSLRASDGVIRHGQSNLAILRPIPPDAPELEYATEEANLIIFD
jgi:hypothetical protein